MAHTPLKITIPQVQDEVRYAWLKNSYSPEATGRALDSIADEPAPYKISHMVSRLFFRGIYFPQKGTWNWLKLIAQNRAPIYRIVKDRSPDGTGQRIRKPSQTSTARSRPKPVRTKLSLRRKAYAGGVKTPRIFFLGIALSQIFCATRLPDGRDYTNSVGMKLVRIEPGSFDMGHTGAPHDMRFRLALDRVDVPDWD